MVAEIQSQPHATVLDYNQCPSQNQRKTISRGVLEHQLHKIGPLLRKHTVMNSCRLYFFIERIKTFPMTLTLSN